MVLKVETDFLMNTVAAVRNTNVCVLFFSLPAVPVSYFFFLIPFPIWLALNVANYPFLLKFVSVPPSFFYHLLLPSLLFPAAPVYRSIFSHVILSPIFLTVCSPPLPPASHLLYLSLAGWLIHFIVCSPQVYPRKSTPAVDGLCVGVPAAEVSQTLLNHTSAFPSSVCLFLSILKDFHAFTHLITNLPATPLWEEFCVACENNIWIRIE